MNALLMVMVLATCAGVVFLAPGKAPGALVVCQLVSLPTLVILARANERVFLLRLFILGLLIRIVVATFIYVSHMQAFFGGDATTYDILGNSLGLSWHGSLDSASAYQDLVRSGASGWGMLYLVAAVYELVGRNMLAVQFISAAAGAATAVLVFEIAQHLYGNIRVSKIAAILTTVFPSLILWSSQGLKDGFIVLLLTLAMFATLQLMDRIRTAHVLVLIIALFALFSLRFYVFYMMSASVVGAMILGMKNVGFKAFVMRFVAIVMIGLTLTWFGVLRSAPEQLDKFGNLEAIQRSRYDMATSAESGFGKDLDVRTTSGALTTIPIGLVYLLLAPFPWQFGSLRQSLALPEMFVWWTCFPLLILGFWFTLRHRLRQATPILLFTMMLTFAYSIFQGNVGTAYRQRSQLLVFYFIFVAVGLTLLKEKSEERQQLRKRQKLAEQEAAFNLAQRRRAEKQAAQVLRESTSQPSQVS